MSMFGKLKKTKEVKEVKKEGGDSEINSGEVLEDVKNEIFNAGGVGKLETLSLGLFRPNPFQPRKSFEKSALEGLAVTIKEKGILNPIIARPNNDPSAECPYDILDGERRWRAAKMAGLTEIPVIIKERNDADMETLAVIGNEQRADLNFMDKMDAYVRLKNLYSNAEGVAANVGFVKRTIEQYFKLHSEINSLPEFADIFHKQRESITYTMADAFSKVASDIRHLQKSNQREFFRIIKNLKVKGVQECLPRLSKKFGVGKTKKALNNDIFRETEKEIALVVRLKKTDTITEAYKEEVRQGIDKFLSKLSVIAPVVE